MSIIGLTLIMTVLSTVISSALGVPLGVMLGSRNFRGKKMTMRILNTLMGLPPVIAGLAVFLLLSRKGLLGSFSLLFTPAAMVIAQVLLITPIIAGLCASAVSLKATSVFETCKGLNLSKKDADRLLIHECRNPIISNCLAGFGRAISEVGAIMIVGGNIQFKTRVITTAIVLETGKGNYETALALGLVLLILSFIINSVVQKLAEKKR